MSQNSSFKASGITLGGTQMKSKLILTECYWVCIRNTLLDDVVDNSVERKEF